MSPTHSHGSAGSGQSGHGSYSSSESASSEHPVGSSPYGHPLDHGHTLQRVEQYPSWGVDGNLAYGSYHGVSMTHVSVGMVPYPQVHPHYLPQAHPYPLVGHPLAPHGIPFLDQRNMPYSPANVYPGAPVPDDVHSHSPAPGSFSDEDDTHEDALPGIVSGDDAFIPTSDEDIRRLLGLRPDQEISLGALADPPPGERPGQTIPALSQLAILGSPRKQLTLKEIFLALQDRFEWFRVHKHEKAWQVC